MSIREAEHRQFDGKRAERNKPGRHWEACLLAVL